MTSIYNISPGFLITYSTYQGKDKLNMEDVFKQLSFEMGGDGSSITKDQLNNYISKADSGDIQVDHSKLSALKIIQKNWDTISKGDNSISYDDMKDYSSLLAATLNGDFTKTEIDDSKSSMKDAIFDYLVDDLGLSSKDEVKKSDLSNYLNKIIANTSNINSTETNSVDSNEADNELIGALTNLIATFSTNSTVEAQA